MKRVDKPISRRDRMKKYQRLLAVVVFLGLLFAVFEVSGLRGHFSLEFLRQQIVAHQLGGLLIFILLFSLGNLIQIPGWIFGSSGAGPGAHHGRARHLHCGHRLLHDDLPRHPLRRRRCAASTGQTDHRAHPTPSGCAPDTQRRIRTHPLPNRAPAELRPRHIRHQVSGLPGRHPAGSAATHLFLLPVF